MELAGASRAPDPTLVRRIYDLHQLHAHIDRRTAIELVRALAIADAREFKNQHLGYVEDIAGETHKAIAFLQAEPAVRERYAHFLTLMVYGEQAGFDTSMATAAAMAQEAWP